MLDIRATKLFKKDRKRMIKRQYDMRRLEDVVDLIATGEPLPPEYRDHLLVKDYAGCHECHIGPDWLLVYEIRDRELLLYLTRTGTHSDLF